MFCVRRQNLFEWMEQCRVLDDGDCTVEVMKR